MAFTRLTNDLAIIAALADLPNSTSGLTATQLKAKFDEAAGLIKTYLNSTLTAELESTTAGDSGIYNMGMSTINGYTNPQLFLQYLYDAISAISPSPQSLDRESIINKNMEVAQRGTSFTIATGTSAYTVDRIKSINNGSGANSTASQVAISDLDGSGYGLQLVHASLPSSDGKLMHVYTLEAADSYKIAGQQRTVSIRVKGVSGMNQATLKARYRTTSGAISDSSTLITSGSATAITTGSWTELTLTYTVPVKATLTTSGCIGFQIVFSKSTTEASGDGAIIAQWHDNKGSTALPFQSRSFAEELALSQRYYEKSYDISVAPGSVLNDGADFGSTSDTASLTFTTRFKVQKRTTPTITIYSTDGTTGVIRNISTSTNSAAASIPQKNTSAFRVLSSSLTASQLYAYQWTADAEL